MPETLEKASRCVSIHADKSCDTGLALFFFLLEPIFQPSRAIFSARDRHI